MEKQFVPYELAVKLKELGFDEPVLGWYNQSKELESENRYGARNFIDAPIWQQSFDWFREKNGLVGNVYANASGYLFEIHHSAKRGGSHQYDSGFTGNNDSGCWDTYESARLACLEKLIEIVSCKSEN